MYNCSGVSLFSLSKRGGGREDLSWHLLLSTKQACPVNPGHVCYQTGTAAFCVLSVKMQRFDVVKTWLLVLYS